jgi:hypothetical protein
MPHRNGPDVFFSFPGRKGSVSKIYIKNQHHFQSEFRISQKRWCFAVIYGKIYFKPAIKISLETLFENFLFKLVFHKIFIFISDFYFFIRILWSSSMFRCLLFNKYRWNYSWKFSFGNLNYYFVFMVKDGAFLIFSCYYYYYLFLISKRQSHNMIINNLKKSNEFKQY